MRKLKNNELGRINIKDFKKVKKTPITIVLDNVRSALNVGAIFRTSDAFLIEKIILCGITSCPPNKEIRKAALGASDSVSWEYSESTLKAIKNLQEHNYHVMGIEQAEGATLLNAFQLPNKAMAIVMGHEVNGVSQEAINLCNEVIEIPQFGTKHSLNIAATTAIVIWDLWHKTQVTK